MKQLWDIIRIIEKALQHNLLFVITFWQFYIQPVFYSYLYV